MRLIRTLPVETRTYAEPGAYQAVLVRHGESLWNRERRFTGWTDIDLTEAGEIEARLAGRLLARDGFQFDLVLTSRLKRSIRSAWLMLEELDQVHVPVVGDWRLNERHYGDLTGRTRSEVEQAYDTQQVLQWRRAFRGKPPPLPEGDPRDMTGDRRYAGISPRDLPRTESLADTAARVQQFWWSAMAWPAIRSGSRLLVCAHGNSLRALVKLLDNVSDHDIMHLDIPNGVPLVYWFDTDGQPTARCFLDCPHPAESNIL
jgi:phosphoglycerate mutase, BPG-dependent, family 1